MTEPFMEVGVAQTLQWLRTERGLAAELQRLEERNGVGLARLTLSAAAGTDAPAREAALAVIPLFVPDEETAARGAALSEALAIEDGLVLWTPPGAYVPDVPGSGAANADAVTQIREAAAGWGTDAGRGQRGEVGFPVRLAVRKVADEGSYLSVQGGLAPHWARFTNQVFGQFQLDSTPIHRLPQDAATVTQLVDFIVLVANGIRAAETTADVPAEDTWSLQRLPGLPGARVIAAAPGSEPEQGAPVRRALRTGTRAALEAFAALDAQQGSALAVRLLTYVGVFRSMADETASIALRGLDPATFARLDAVCLVADGELRTLFGPTPESQLGEAR